MEWEEEVRAREAFVDMTLPILRTWVDILGQVAESIRASHAAECNDIDIPELIEDAAASIATAARELADYGS